MSDRFRLSGTIVLDDGDGLTLQDCVIVLNMLHRENEELKQRIKQLEHWNKCLAEKRHQELKGEE